MLLKALSANPDLKLLGDEGAFRATIATLGTLDKDGDVTLPGAFPVGKAVKVAAWGHNWAALPVGKATIGADQSRAWVDGRFFLDTTQGRDTYNTVKGLGADQEWSYGFEILDAEYGPFQGKQARFLKSLNPFEASPVMVGAGFGTGTDWIKSADVGDELKAVWSTAYVNNLPDSAFAYIEPGGSKDGEGKTVPRSLRHYPHHDMSGAVDLPHLRNALARGAANNAPESAMAHLQHHADAAGVGKDSDPAAELKHDAMSRGDMQNVHAAMSAMSAVHDKHCTKTDCPLNPMGGKAADPRPPMDLAGHCKAAIASLEWVAEHLRTADPAAVYAARDWLAGISDRAEKGHRAAESALRLARARLPYDLAHLREDFRSAEAAIWGGSPRRGDS